MVIHAIEWLVHVLALLAACAAMLWLGTFAVGTLFDRIQSRRGRWDAEFIKGQFLLVDRFCSYDFPIIEDILEHMGPAFEGRNPPESMTEFRDRLRAKYGGRSARAS